jgi:nicotinate-nucleotide adenylyltransferase
VCAQQAHAQLGLDVVLWIPTGVPPHKELRDDPGPELRAELCRLAVDDDPRFEVSTIEIERQGPSYTVDTLRSIHERAPENELIFIAGGDMARSLPSWREPEQVLVLATFAVAERAGAERDDILAALSSLGSAAASRTTFFDMPRIDVSSSEVRRRVAAGEPIGDLVPPAVAEAIETRGLYA